MPFVELFDPDVDLRVAEGWPEPGPFVGREAVMRQFGADARDLGRRSQLEPISDFIDAADRVVVDGIWRGTGSGPESNMEFDRRLHGAQGQGLPQEYFWDHAEALEALGLSEQDAHADS